MLEGMRVVELAYFYPAPYCTQILAELGAEGIKIEPPSGDPMRYRSEIFAALNRNKKSLVLNLKDEKDLSKFYEIVGKSDVVVEGFRPGVAKKLGVDYESVKKVNPGIIYCSIPGLRGVNKPVHDINVLSLAGICLIAGKKFGKPIDPNVQLSDFASAVFAAISILAAYVRKIKTGEGCYINLSMLDAALASVPLHSARLLNGMDVAEDFVSNPGYDVYEAKNGYVSVGILDEKHFWKEFCEKLGLEYGDLSFEERIKRADEIRKRISEVLKDKSVEELEGILENVPFSAVRNFPKESEIFCEAEYDKKYRVVGFPATFSNFEPKRSGKVPKLGEDRDI
ncbi:L-carnitine dehydratase/bile acid-inducible protein F [Ferroglobus placidus DSM 10642]|uniref:L-carnitine dehydratase/bile acid-inducible protein F n=1 Tax=Ferroglobus placidus (strain DSM 10642 / AEDII12DO) TaxID=589924 RepID=D3RY17_FERPA|nr:CoA transferase [Ferroglobus placidus]ADC65380.1 L-carnitine dehydratase/bile acid-inducible protein F [Ferroglobus placidus DSM 10642]